MSKVYKISGYVVNANDDTPAEMIKNFIENEFERQDCSIDHLHVQESKPFEWNDDLPINQANCPLAAYDAYFPKEPDAESEDGRTVVIGGIYRHFKGNYVIVLGVVTDTESPDTHYVVYADADGNMWSRPYSMFLSEVDHEKYPKAKQRYRFIFVADGKDDKVLSVNEYQEKALRTAPTDKLSKSSLLENAALGLCGESGEVADIVKKVFYQGHDLDVEHIAKELGDVAWYLALAAYAIDKDLNEIMQGNIDKLLARYPDGFDADKSRNRKDGDI